MPVQVFTSPRTTWPDEVTLQAQLRAALDQTAGHFIDRDARTVTVKKNTPWTPSQINSAQNVIDTVPAFNQFVAASRQKDVVTTCAIIVRERGIAAWNAMSLQQKKDAATALADVWANIREAID